MEHLAERLSLGADRLAVALTGEQLAVLGGYLALLEKWNAKLNLVGPGTKELWADRHILDSLAPIRWVEPVREVIDVGSGAGLPGIPLAVALPQIQFVLLEPRATRAAFLRNVVAGLRLGNVRVSLGRADAVRERFPLVLGRAVAPPVEFAEMAAGLAVNGGKMVLFAQAEPPEKLGRWAERETWSAYRAGAEPERMIGLYRLFHVEQSA